MHLDGDIHITEEIFAAAYNTHWKTLYTTCRRYVPHAEPAREIVQDLFISLWEKRETLVIHTSLDTYLFSALKLKVLEYYRKQAVRDQYLAYRQYTAQEAQQTTEEQVYFNELKNALDSAIQSLPERSRQVYQLSREKGWNNKSIAHALLISEKTVEGNMTRALNFIRRKLKDFKL
ncbi:RNA polymerase sigma-70 factor [Chitinophaga solisilvae]|uniref:RNA polymerase sigma-70 factor n=1 Tax=Chitinophaga solisilvae TaxID=1233460 RepID=A0A433W9D7_9BACT|nr:RNA polymerase sigma-70 factor [Chitinophaga solisilvae]NSL86261.1 RNA polymerase sigma-70 factor [Chitinophaga solisilvae]